MNIYIATGLLLFGVGAHYLQVLAALEAAGTHLTPLAYLRQHPYRFASMLVTAFIAMLVVRELGELTKVAAVLLGYTCQNAADIIRKRANSRMNK